MNSKLFLTLSLLGCFTQQNNPMPKEKPYPQALPYIEPYGVAYEMQNGVFGLIRNLSRLDAQKLCNTLKERRDFTHVYVYDTSMLPSCAFQHLQVSQDQR